MVTSPGEKEDKFARGNCIAHSALIHRMIETLRDKGVLSKAEIEQIFLDAKADVIKRQQSDAEIVAQEIIDQIAKNF